MFFCCVVSVVLDLTIDHEQVKNSCSFCSFNSSRPYRRTFQVCSPFCHVVSVVLDLAILHTEYEQVKPHLIL